MTLPMTLTDRHSYSHHALRKWLKVVHAREQPQLDDQVWPAAPQLSILPWVGWVGYLPGARAHSACTCHVLFQITWDTLVI